MEALFAPVSSVPRPEEINILVVDPDTMSLMRTASMLERFRHKVSTTELAAVALSMLGDESRQFHLVLASRYIRDVDIFMFVNNVRQHDNLLPVIVTTIVKELKFETQVGNAGAWYVLRDPISRDDMTHVWRYACYRRNAISKKISEVSKIQEVQGVPVTNPILLNAPSGKGKNVVEENIRDGKTCRGKSRNHPIVLVGRERGDKDSKIKEVEKVPIASSGRGIQGDTNPIVRTNRRGRGKKIVEENIQDGKTRRGKSKNHPIVLEEERDSKIKKVERVPVASSRRAIRDDTNPILLSDPRGKEKKIVEENIPDGKMCREKSKNQPIVLEDSEGEDRVSRIANKKPHTKFWGDDEIEGFKIINHKLYDAAGLSKYPSQSGGCKNLNPQIPILNVGHMYQMGKTSYHPNQQTHFPTLDLPPQNSSRDEYQVPRGPLDWLWEKNPGKQQMPNQGKVYPTVKSPILPSVSPPGEYQGPYAPSDWVGDINFVTQGKPATPPQWTSKVFEEKNCPAPEIPNQPHDGQFHPTINLPNISSAAENQGPSALPDGLNDINPLTPIKPASPTINSEDLYMFAYGSPNPPKDRSPTPVFPASPIIDLGSPTANDFDWFNMPPE